MEGVEHPPCHSFGCEGVPEVPATMPDGQEASLCVACAVEAMAALGMQMQAQHRDHASNVAKVANSAVVGKVAEVYPALRFGWRMNLVWQPGGDGGIDFHQTQVGTVDVKATRHPRGGVWVEKGKPLVADAFVLVRMREGDDFCAETIHSASIKGWLTREDFEAWAEDHTRPDGVAYRIARRFRTPGSLVDRVRPAVDPSAGEIF